MLRAWASDTPDCNPGPVELRPAASTCGAGRSLSCTIIHHDADGLDHGVGRTAEPGRLSGGQTPAKVASKLLGSRPEEREGATSRVSPRWFRRRTRSAFCSLGPPRRGRPAWPRPFNGSPASRGSSGSITARLYQPGGAARPGLGPANERRDFGRDVECAVVCDGGRGLGPSGLEDVVPGGARGDECIEVGVLLGVDPGDDGVILRDL